MDELTSDELQAIEMFRTRVKHILKPDMYEDILLFYRFLKARDFDMDAAEAMLRKCVHWRKVFQVDTILDDFKPKEVFLKYVEPDVIGFDKEGCIFVYCPTGKTDIREIMKCVKTNNFYKHCIWFGEKMSVTIKRQCEIMGMKAYKGSFIFDLDKLTLGNATYKGTADLFLYIANLYQNNYPEYMKSVYVINAPSYYVLIFSLIKAVVSSVTLQKIHIYGYSGWKEKLLEMIDADVLPKFLGGNRTDSDGNPLCRSLVQHGGNVSSIYYLSDKDRNFKDRTRVKSILVPKLKKEEISVDVRKIGSVIQWEFYVKHNIGFGLFYQITEEEVEEVIPVFRYGTSDGTEEGSYKVASTGKYIIVFDNTNSWLSSKEVEYCIEVINPAF